MKKLKAYLNSVKKYQINTINKLYLSNEVKYILDKYKFTIHELCYRLQKNIPFNKIFFCKNCHKKILFHKRRKYQTFCSNKCQAIYNWNIGLINEKRKQTCLKKYGVENYSKTKEYLQKSKQTCLRRYGVSSYTQTQECKDKHKKTCLKLYGKDNYAKTYMYKDYMKIHNDSFQEKIYTSKKINNTLTTSNQEEKVYELLLTKFSKDDIIRQYKSKLYPFACDFYIKNLDLYIEYNGYWTHGWNNRKLYGSFDINNSDHLKLLDKWKAKSNELNFRKSKKDQYKSAIYTWTILDPLKLKTAKDNKLNYKIFWTVKEVEDWIKNTSRL